MPIAVQNLETGVTKIVISGRIDLAGCEEIEMPLKQAGGAGKAVVIDLSGVNFMASLGLRSIVLAGKAVMRKGGKMVLLSPQAIVEEVIVTSGVDEMIPIFREEAAAIAAVAPVAA